MFRVADLRLAESEEVVEREFIALLNGVWTPEASRRVLAEPRVEEEALGPLVDMDGHRRGTPCPSVPRSRKRRRAPPSGGLYGDGGDPRPTAEGCRQRTVWGSGRRATPWVGHR